MMQKRVVAVLICLFVMAGAARAQHNTCLLAETVLDSLGKLYAQEYANMVCYTDATTLTLDKAQLTDLYKKTWTDKRILKATHTEDMHVNDCRMTKVNLHTNVSPDSLDKYIAYQMTKEKTGMNFINDAGLRFSNILYSRDLIVGRVQLKMRMKAALYYYFIFEKNKQSGDWAIVKLVKDCGGCPRHL